MYCDEIAREFHPQLINLFGSHAHGTRVRRPQSTLRSELLRIIMLTMFTPACHTPPRSESVEHASSAPSIRSPHSYAGPAAPGAATASPESPATDPPASSATAQPSSATAHPSPISAPPQPSLPASVDLRPWLLALELSPRPQGARGTCSIFTTCSAIEFALAVRRGQALRLSPEYLNWAAGQASGQPSDGNFFHNALAGFERHGICAESNMPYAAAFDPNSAPSAAAAAEATLIREQSRGAILVHWIVPWTPDRFGVSPEQFAEIKRVLALGYPVAAGSGHSRLLVGYRDDLSLPGGGAFLTEDSALNRFDEVTYEFVTKDVADVYWIEALRMQPAASQELAPGR